MEYKDFFYQAAIYLLAAVLSVPLAKRLGFGSVLGYLIAGIIIGPYALGMVGEHSQDIMHFAEFGVVMMLFLIGLELRPALLWQLRAHILGLGLLQISLTTFAFSGIFYFLGHPLSIAVVIGMILSMSSTAIVIQIFSEKGWIQTPVGQATFSVLLFQDMAVIPIMAIIPLLTYASRALPVPNSLISQLNHWQQALVTLGIIAAIVVSGRFLLRPLFRFIAQAKLREVFTAASLLLVIANALIMQAIGLSPALGTFLAGALLAESEYRHELEADIEPFKGLLLGLFFISVGANINFNILLENPAGILKLIFLLVLIKSLVLFFIAKIFKFNTQNSLLFSLTLAQGGEFCFVLLSHAVANQALAPYLANQLVVAVAISMVLKPLMIIFFEKLLAPYFICRQEQKKIDPVEGERNPVIIAGFGRYGQIIGRLLIANKIKATVLDLDADNIELIRKFGFKVFYGDASRFDLLEAAGIAHAKLFILAIDDSEKALEIAMHVREHYPALKILARVRGRTQAYDFLKKDFTSIYRETFDSSLAMAVDALKELGFPAYHALRCVRFFKQHDEQSVKRMYKLYGAENEMEYINKAKQSRRNLEKAFSEDTAGGQFSFDLAWDPENAKDRGESS